MSIPTFVRGSLAILGLVIVFLVTAAISSQACAVIGETVLEEADLECIVYGNDVDVIIKSQNKAVSFGVLHIRKLTRLLGTESADAPN